MYKVELMAIRRMQRILEEFMLRKIRVFFILIIISGCTYESKQGGSLKKQPNAKELISLIPPEERFVLEYFFRCLIQEDTVGYVLLGGKPMSFYSYLQPKIIVDPSLQSDPVKQLDLLFDGFDDKDALFHRGWEIWKKYEHYFCGENMFFDAFEEDMDLHSMKVIVINKHLILPLLEQYFDKFTSLDSSLKDKESLFGALLHDHKFKEKFYSHHNLVGICVGYGERNAMLFQKMLKLFASMGWLGFTLAAPPPDRLKNLEEEWSVLRQSFHVGVKDHVSRRLLFHFGVGFRAEFSNPETLALQKKYTKYHKKITHTYDRANFLEKTLELIYLANHLHSS